MYILELVAALFRKKKVVEPQIYNPIVEPGEIVEEECTEHIFMPIDSSGETLACRNCGQIISREAFEKKNIFKNN